MIGVDRLDRRQALAYSGRACCSVCSRYYRLDEVEAGVSSICPDCIRREPAPLQDNLPEGSNGFLQPREDPEVTIARAARREAEEMAHRYRLALLQHHQILSAIAGSYGKRPLRLFPKDQSKLASYALDLLEENFPDIAERLGLRIEGESR